jgi:NAD(P)-dependent dehydrogenase (short-subunit alcohol dehydrogenase family)
MSRLQERFGLAGRVVVVTGGGDGIGRATALVLADAGAAVGVLDRDGERAAATAATIADRDGLALGLGCDVTDAEGVAGAFAAIAERLGPIDGLVNNAGSGSHTRPEQMSADEWDTVLAVNLTAGFRCAQALARDWIAQGRRGAIVNLSSIAGTTALGRGNVAYSASKGAIDAATRELAVEWAQHGIRVNAVAPAQTRTPKLAEWVESDRGGETGGAFLRGLPLGRLVEPEEVADAILFLLSDAAAMITGTVLPVDGGNLALNASGTIGGQAWKGPRG